MTCKYWDCGWCYCKSGKSNDDNGQCNSPSSCKENKKEGAEWCILEQGVQEVAHTVRRHGP